MNYLQLRSMDARIDKMNSTFRKSIRRAQLDHIFKQRRVLSEEFGHEDSQNVLMNSLNQVKMMFINHDESLELIRHLAIIHKLSSEYRCIDIMCKLAQFNGESINSKLPQQNFTWVDLFLQLLCDNWQSPIIYQESSAIINNCAYQLMINMKKDVNAVFAEQIKRLMQRYPFDFLKEDSSVLVGNTLMVIGSICNTNSSASIYHLLNKTNPPLIKMLNLLYNKKELMSVATVQNEYASTCTIIAAIIQHYSFELLQQARYDAFCKNLREVVLKQLEISQSKEQFQKSCERLYLLTKIKMFLPSLEQYNKIEDFLKREIQEENIYYFRLLSQIFNLTSYKLTSISFKKLTDYLFAPKHANDEDDGKLKLRIKLLQIIKYHIINCGNRLKAEELATMQQVCDSDGFAVIDLAERLQEYSPSHLKLLFEVLSHLIYESSSSMELIEGIFYPLLRFSEYRVLLQSMGFVLSEEDEFDINLYDL